MPARRKAAEGYGTRISDPQALRALAHTGRYAILERLQSGGPATATECAEVAGLSPSACSYHLRLLAKHGFVEEDTSDEARRDRRERVWRAAITGWWSDLPDDGDRREQRALDATLSRVMMASSDRRLLAFLDRADEEPAWRDAALFSNSTVVATAEELAQISQALLGVLRPYFVSARAERPDGARDVHVSIRMAPRPPEGTAAHADADDRRED